MKFNRAEVRMINGYPIGIQLVIDLNESETKELDSLVTEDVGRNYGIFLDDKSSQLLCAPGISSTVERIADQVKNFCDSQPENHVLKDLASMMNKLKDFSEKHTLNAGKGRTEKNYEEKITRESQAFSQKFRTSLEPKKSFLNRFFSAAKPEPGKVSKSNIPPPLSKPRSKL